jgi:hypothetical protein
MLGTTSDAPDDKPKNPTSGVSGLVFRKETNFSQKIQVNQSN